MNRILGKWGVLIAIFGIALVGCDKPHDEPPVVLKDDIESIRMNVAETAGTEESKHLLLVCNIDSEEGIELAEYYARKRKVPPSNIVQIKCPPLEETSMARFKEDILEPIKTAIEGSKERIDYIVLTKGIPFRIDSWWGYSVDGQIAGMNLRVEPMPNDKAPTEDGMIRCKNPYYDAKKPFNSKDYGIYLVTRLDAFSLTDAKRLVERSVKAQPEKGLFFFDQAENRTNNPEMPESAGWHQVRMEAAVAKLLQKNKEVRIDKTAPFLNPGKPMMGYVSWGSNDGKFDLKTYRGLKFLSGSICETYVSTSARTFIPSEEGQSLIGDLIANGVTGVKGYVSEPWTSALCRVDILMDRYTDGYNLAESFYASSPLVLWKDVVIGDPLCRPYAKK